jgi:hypothetical protein
MTTYNQEVKTGVFYVLDPKFDVVSHRQEVGRLFFFDIGFLRIHGGEIIGVYGGEVWGDWGRRVTGTYTGVFSVVERGEFFVTSLLP